MLYTCADEAAHRLKLNAEFASSLGELAECMARQRCDAFLSPDCIFIYNKQVSVGETKARLRKQGHALL